jgi:hypothetical protein
LQVTIQLTEAAARALQQHQAIPELGRLANQLGIIIQPLHPQSLDQALMTFFSAEVPDADTAQRVLTKLLQSPHVTAAYLKPPDAPPEF